MLNYEDEVIDKRMLVMVTSMYLIFLAIIIYLYIKEIYDGALACSGFYAIMLIFIPLAYRQKKKFVNKRNEIIENGVKLNGKIVDTDIHYEYSTDSDGNTSSRRVVKIVVEYDYKGKIERFTTPPVVFSEDNIERNDVMVYVSDVGVYVDEFKLKKELKNFLPMK